MTLVVASLSIKNIGRIRTLEDTGRIERSVKPYFELKFPAASELQSSFAVLCTQSLLNHLHDRSDIQKPQP